MAKKRKKVKYDNRPFIGTCSNCRDKKVQVVKVLTSQICVEKCLIASLKPGERMQVRLARFLPAKVEPLPDGAQGI